MKSHRTQIKPGQKLDLDLTEAERQHILDDLTCLDADLEAIVRQTAPDQPIKMTLDDLDQLSGCVAAEANHTKNKKLGKNLDHIFGKITALLDKYTDEPPPKPLTIETAKQAKMISGQAAHIADWVAQALGVAEQLRIKTKMVDTFVPGKLERTVLSTLPAIPAKIRNKVSRGEITFTAVEVAGMAMAVAEELPGANTQQQVGLLMVAKTLMDSLQRWIADAGKTKLGKKSKSTAVYQFKISLLEAKPPIWRRIQVHGCTLDELHEHIQTAMGWTNSHLHQFEIGNKRYGDPLLLEEMEDIEFEDSTTTMLSEILPANGKRLRFTYEYDFGDDWQHEVLFEGCLKPEKGARFPVCLEGERACPPEDVGGVWGYASFLEAIAEPKHEEHEAMLEWAGAFDPEKFDPAKATKAMKKGLPDWRNDDDAF